MTQVDWTKVTNDFYSEVNIGQFSYSINFIIQIIILAFISGMFDYNLLNLLSLVVIVHVVSHFFSFIIGAKVVNRRGNINLLKFFGIGIGIGITMLVSNISYISPVEIYLSWVTSTFFAEVLTPTLIIMLDHLVIKSRDIDSLTKK